MISKLSLLNWDNALTMVPINARPRPFPPNDPFTYTGKILNIRRIVFWNTAQFPNSSCVGIEQSDQILVVALIHVFVIAHIHIFRITVGETWHAKKET